MLVSILVAIATKFRIVVAYNTVGYYGRYLYDVAHLYTILF